MDTRTRQTERTERTPHQRRRWSIAAVAFLAVLTVAGALIVATLADGGEVADTTPPVEVVDAFFVAWNAGDTAAAAALLHPEVTVPLGARNLTGWIAFTSQFDGAMETDCMTAGPATVTCEWMWITAGTETMATNAVTEHTITVTEGVITRMTLPNYGAFEAPLARFAQAEDGYTEACGPDGVAVTSLAGYALTERCGSFLAGYEAAYVAGLNG